MEGGKAVVEFILSQRDATGSQKFALKPDRLEAERAKFAASSIEDPIMLKLLLDQDIMTTRALRRHGNALLNQSIFAQNMEATKKLIDILLAHGVDIDTRDQDS